MESLGAYILDPPHYYYNMYRAGDLVIKRRMMGGVDAQSMRVHLSDSDSGR